MWVESAEFHDLALRSICLGIPLILASIGFVSGFFVTEYGCEADLCYFDIKVVDFNSKP